MRLWGGLIFRNGFRVVPPPVAARFPSLETVKTVTSPAMPTPPRQCENSAGGGQGAPATTPWRDKTSEKREFGAVRLVPLGFRRAGPFCILSLLVNYL
jgi:hypothetical protein